MVAWHVDRGPYCAAYEAAVDNRLALEPLSAPISTPEFVATSSDYEASDHRLLVLGQETAGNWRFMADRTGYDVSAESLGHYIRFDLSIGTNLTGTPFWRAYRQAKESFGLPERGVAWANISSVQRCDQHGSSIVTLSEEEQTRIAAWQRQHVLEMFRFVRPRKVLALTGPYYDWLLKDVIADLELAPVADYDARKVAEGTSTSLGFSLVRTYHPGYLNKRGGWSMLDAAIQRLRAM